MYIQRRDNMGFDIAPFLIVVLVILGAGGLVICGAVVMRFYSTDDTQERNFMNRSVEQDRYMREVRERSWGRLPRYYLQRQQPSPSFARAEVQSVNASNTTYS